VKTGEVKASANEYETKWRRGWTDASQTLCYGVRGLGSLELKMPNIAEETRVEGCGTLESAAYERCYKHDREEARQSFSLTAWK